MKDRATMGQLKGSGRPSSRQEQSGTELVLEAKLNRGAFQSTFPGKFHSDGGTMAGVSEVHGGGGEERSGLFFSRLDNVFFSREIGSSTRETDGDYNFAEG